jgi:apolipoprotein N-acyltransferase
MEIIAGSTDFALGEGQRIVGINDELNFIPAICYEIIFFWKLINDENNNADFIINLTNDSWFGQLSGPYQHFYLSRLRAAEFNKPLIRVSNNGISAAIDNFGNIIDYIELNKKEVKEINIQIPELKNNFIYYHRFIFYFFILLFLMGLFLNKKNDT